MVQGNAPEVSFFVSGYCVSPARVVNPKGPGGNTRFHAVWALLHTPDTGYILFDTGYTQRFQQATQPFPQRLYRWFTPCVVTEEETALQTLRQRGIPPETIRYIIVSHFHADHIGGLRDFPQAQILCSAAAFQQTVELRGIRAVSRAILHDLIPEDISERVRFVEDISEKSIHASGLQLFALFGNPALRLVLLPGHAKGMLGFWIQDILYASDAAWSSESFDQGILPQPVAKLFFDSWDDYTATWKKLKYFQLQHPEVRLLFTHCPGTLNWLQ